MKLIPISFVVVAVLTMFIYNDGCEISVNEYTGIKELSESLKDKDVVSFPQRLTKYHKTAYLSDERRNVILDIISKSMEDSKIVNGEYNKIKRTTLYYVDIQNYEDRKEGKMKEVNDVKLELAEILGWDNENIFNKSFQAKKRAFAY